MPVSLSLMFSDLISRGYLAEALSLRSEISKESDWDIAHWAAWHGKTSLIPFMVEHGLDLNEEKKPGIRPIHIASRLRKIDYIEGLIQADAKYINTPDVYGRDALWLLTHASPLEAEYSKTQLVDLRRGVRLLVKSGCDPKSSRGVLGSPSDCLIAPNYGSSDLYEMLLEEGCELSISGKRRLKEECVRAISLRKEFDNEYVSNAFKIMAIMEGASISEVCSKGEKRGRGRI